MATHALVHAPTRPELDINLLDPAVQQCPYEAYRILRDEPKKR